MAGIRQRAASKKDPSPPLYSVEKLSADVRQLKQSAIEKEVTLKELMGSTAVKDQLKIPSETQHTKKGSASKSSTSPLWSTLFLCYRVMVMFSLTFVVLTLLIWFSPSITSILLKYVHTRLYYIIRPFRMGIATVYPLLNTFGLDLINSDCFLENPFISEANYCPCLRVKFPKELELTAESPTLPDTVFQLPTYDVFIARNALDTSKVTVEAFRDFKRNHPTHRGPKSCLKLTTNTEAGVQKMSELYDPELLEQHLNANTSWAFTWEECPIEERPQTFRDVYPEPDYLPPDIELSDVTLFTLSTQWAQLMYNEASFQSGSLVATLVLLGEVRFSIDQIHEECLEHCSSFREQVVLQAGDVLLFDQSHWGFMAVTWSKQALTTTMAVKKPTPQ